MWWLAVNDEIPGQVCKSALWDHINGWEVVIAVAIIMAFWTVQRVAQMYYTWRISARNNPDS